MAFRSAAVRVMSVVARGVCVSASKAAGLSAQAVPDVFVAADVGGTHVRIALVRERLGGARGIEVLAVQKYRCAEFDGLAAIFATFLAQAPGADAVRRGVIASAGYALEDGSVITANLPWPLLPRQIQQQLGWHSLELVNDFEAVAHAARQMGEHEVLHLAGPREGAGPVFVLGPGTGLGAALFAPTAAGAFVLATEAGHAALAPGSDLEVQVLGVLRRDRSHVAIEHLLSGPGLLNFYTAVCTLRAAPAVQRAPDQVTRAALAGEDALAVEALAGFCGLLGSVVGDMALLYGARTVYLAGGFLPQIAGFLAGSDFVARMHDKGAMRPALQQVSVKVVEHGLLGVIGAASWLCQRPR
jgi:glucokinase